MGLFIDVEDDDGEDNMGCPEVNIPSFFSWLEYVEPAKVVLLQYANNGEPIPEIDILINSLEGVFKI